VLYVAGQDWDGTDGGGKARIGIATGPTLDALTLHKEYVIGGTANTRDERSVFPNGALVLENGTVQHTPSHTQKHTQQQSILTKHTCEQTSHFQHSTPFV
jgi:hypothetical protein